MKVALSTQGDIYICIISPNKPKCGHAPPEGVGRMKVALSTQDSAMQPSSSTSIPYVPGVGCRKCWMLCVRVSV
jgi:hypothetical protein